MVNQSSRYKLSDGTNFQYQDLGGDILAVPEEIKSKLKQWNKKQKLEEIEMDVVEKVEKFKISSYDRTINYTSIRNCLEKFTFFRDSQNYDSCVMDRGITLTAYANPEVDQVRRALWLLTCSVAYL